MTLYSASKPWLSWPYLQWASLDSRDLILNEQVLTLVTVSLTSTSWLSWPLFPMSKPWLSWSHLQWASLVSHDRYFQWGSLDSRDRQVWPDGRWVKPCSVKMSRYDGLTREHAEWLPRYWAGTRHWTNTNLMLVQCCDAGPTLNQHWFNVPCLLGMWDMICW